MHLAASAEPRPVAEHAAQTDEAGPVDRARFVQRVAGAIRGNSDRGGSIRLQLSPPELGTLRVEIRVHDGAMTARLETENQAARNLLLDNLPALRERLAQQDIKVQQFDIDLMDRSPGRSPDQNAYSGESFGRSPNGGNGRAPVRENQEARPSAAVSAPRRLGEGSQLNIII